MSSRAPFGTCFEHSLLAEAREHRVEGAREVRDPSLPRTGRRPRDRPSRRCGAALRAPDGPCEARRQDVRDEEREEERDGAGQGADLEGVPRGDLDGAEGDTDAKGVNALAEVVHEGVVDLDDVITGAASLDAVDAHHVPHEDRLLRAKPLGRGRWRAPSPSAPDPGTAYVELQRERGHHHVARAAASETMA